MPKFENFFEFNKLKFLMRFDKVKHYELWKNEIF